MSEPTNHLARFRAFTYSDNCPLRIQVVDGKPWFCLSDVGRVLEIKDHTDFTRSKWCDKEGVGKFPTPSDGGDQAMMYISERNLYAMTSRSTKDEAVKFMDWIFGEILPAIRETGAYVAPGAVPPTTEVVTLQLVTMVMKQMENLTVVVGKLVDDVQQSKAEHAPPLRLESGRVRRVHRAQPELIDCEWEVAPGRYEGYTTVAKVRYMMARYKKASRQPWPNVYGKLYDRYERASGVPIRSERRRRRPGLSDIVYIEDYGDIELLHEIAVNMLDEIGEVA